MTKLNSWLNYKPTKLTEKQIKKAGYGPSMTVPDQALSLNQLLYNHTRGMPVPEREPVFHGERYVPEFGSMDITEIREYRQNLQQEISDLEQAVKLSEEEAYKKRMEEKLKKEQPEPIMEPEKPEE